MLTKIPIEFDAAIRRMARQPISRVLAADAVLVFSESDAIHLQSWGILNDQPIAEKCGIVTE